MHTSERHLTPQRVRAWHILGLALIGMAGWVWLTSTLYPELTSLSVDEVLRRGPSRENVEVAFLLHGILLLVLLVPVWQAGHSPRSIIGPVPSRTLASWSLRVGLALFLLGAGTVHLLGPVVIDVYPDVLAQWMFVAAHGTVFDAGLLTSALAIVEVALVGVFVEELIFRGLILPSWEARWGWRWAVGLSSLVWTLFHPMDMLGALIFGVVAAVAYLRTRMLLVPFLIHAGNNAAAMLVALVYEVLPGGSPFASPEAFRAHWWVGVIGLLLGVPWLWHLLHAWPELQPAQRAGAGSATMSREVSRADLPASRQ